MYDAEETVRLTLSSLTLCLAAALTIGCTAEKPAAPPQTGAPQVGTTVFAVKHPLAKFLELVAFRVSEKGQGKLAIKFAVVNHSEADIGDLTLKVKLTTTAAKPEDPPITELEVKVPGVGPQELKEVEGTGTTKLRIYELPDWQFIRAEVEITSPPAE